MRPWFLVDWAFSSSPKGPILLLLKRHATHTQTMSTAAMNFSLLTFIVHILKLALVVSNFGKQFVSSSSEWITFETGVVNWMSLESSPRKEIFHWNVGVFSRYAKPDRSWAWVTFCTEFHILLVSIWDSFLQVLQFPPLPRHMFVNTWLAAIMSVWLDWNPTSAVFLIHVLRIGSGPTVTLTG